MPAPDLGDEFGVGAWRSIAFITCCTSQEAIHS